MRRGDYDIFWRQVDTPLQAAQYLGSILEKVKQALEPKDQKDQKASDKKEPNVPKESTLPLESLLTTVSFVVHNLDFGTEDPDGKINEFLTFWQKSECTKEVWRKHHGMREVIRMLLLKREKADMTGPLVIASSTLHSGEATEEDNKSNEGAFTFSAIKKLTEDPKHRLAVVQSIVDKMLTVGQQMKINPKMSQTTILALSFMLRSLLQLGPISDSTLLRRGLAFLQPFYLWPQPICGVAKDTLSMLQNELISPGHNLRARLTAEALSGYQWQGQDKLPALFYLYDDSDIRVLSLARMLKLPTTELAKNDKRKARDVLDVNPLPPQTQAQLLYHIFKAEGELSAQEEEHMRTLAPEQLSSLYDRAIEALREASEQRDLETGITAKRQAIATVRADLPNAAQASQGKPFTVKLPEGPVELPRVPALLHLGLKAVLHDRYAFEDKVSASLMCVTDLYPIVNLQNQLEDLMSMFTGSEKKPLTLRLALCGGNRLLHQFLCAYLSVLTSKPQLFEGLQLRFFVLPPPAFQTQGSSSPNSSSAADWLASRDSWYFRNIYNPLRQPLFVVPQLSAEGLQDEKEEKHSDEDVSALGKLLRGTIETFSREASVVVPVTVFKVEAWLNPPEKDAKDPGHDQCIPVLVRVEMGEATTASQAARRRKVSESREDKEKLDPPELRIKYRKLISSGVVGPELVEDSVTVSQLTLSHFPGSRGGSYPDPCSSALEMFARIKSRPTKTSKLFDDPFQSVVEADIIVTDTEKRFELMVDDNAVGPFYRIRISPVLLDNAQLPAAGQKFHAKSQLTFPVQSFFPSLA